MSRYRALSLLALISFLTLMAPARSQPAGALGDDFIYRVRPGDTLIDLATRYVTDRQAEAGARLGVLGSWLLPVLVARVEAL